MREYFEKFGHFCELNLDDDYQNYLNGKTKFKRNLIKWTTIDPASPLTLQYFKSNLTIYNDRKMHLNLYLGTIHPFSRFKFVWEVVMIIIFLIGLIYHPLQYFSYVDRNREDDAGNIFLMGLLKIFCIVDIILRFFIGHFDNETFMVIFLIEHFTILIEPFYCRLFSRKEKLLANI